MGIMTDHRMTWLHQDQKKVRKYLLPRLAGATNWWRSADAPSGPGQAGRGGLLQFICD